MATSEIACWKDTYSCISGNQLKNHNHLSILIKQFSQERSKLSTMPLKCYFNSERTDHKKATNGSYYLHDKSICCRRGLLALLL